MQNFDKKVKYLDSLFIYKFKFYDYDSHKVKIYYISPDNQHIYLMLDAVPNTDMTYNCELGELYFDEIKNTTFEDTPTENVTINTSEFKIFRKYYDTIPTWAPKKIKELKEIIDSTDKKDLSL